MSTPDKPALVVINTQYLSALDKSQLLDLLTHRTQLLVATRNAGIVDPGYTINLQQEVQAIQSEIWIRNR